MSETRCCATCGYMPLMIGDVYYCRHCGTLTHLINGNEIVEVPTLVERCAALVRHLEHMTPEHYYTTKVLCREVAQTIEQHIHPNRQEETKTADTTIPTDYRAGLAEE